MLVGLVSTVAEPAAASKHCTTTTCTAHSRINGKPCPSRAEMPSGTLSKELLHNLKGLRR
jgi:hypothetical protein